LAVVERFVAAVLPVVVRGLAGVAVRVLPVLSVLSAMVDPGPFPLANKDIRSNCG
jgi:hypothetical protein